MTVSFSHLPRYQEDFPKDQIEDFNIKYGLFVLPPNAIQSINFLIEMFKGFYD